MTTQSLIATHAATPQRGGIFSVVSVCGCVFVSVITGLEPFEISSSNYYGSKICSIAQTTSKMATFRCTAAGGRAIYTFFVLAVKQVTEPTVLCQFLFLQRQPIPERRPTRVLPPATSKSTSTFSILDVAHIKTPSTTTINYLSTLTKHIQLILE